MKAVRDSNDHLICMVDISTGYVEASYKRQTTSTYLAVGESFRIERCGAVTIVTRDSTSTVKVERHRIVN